MAIGVTLREKPIKGNLLSIYLDFYPPIPNPETGKPTRRGFLKLYVHSEFEYEVQAYTDANGKPKERVIPVVDRKGEHKRRRLAELERDHNNRTRELAEAIRAQRQLDVQAKRFGFLTKVADPTCVDFIQFFREQAAAFEQTNRSRGHKNSMNSAYRHFTVFAGKYDAISRPIDDELDKLTFSATDLTKQVCEQFRDYLSGSKSLNRPHKPLAGNSAVAYFVLFKQVVAKAVEDRIMPIDPTDKVVISKAQDKEREYLTAEELQTLYETDCDWPIIKRASLFSALTGLRYSDVEKLTWGEVRQSKAEGNYIRFRTKKTGRPETLPINDDAVEQMGERKSDTTQVFEGLAYSDWQNSKMKEWIVRAGIRKHITFHCFRHTYATLLLTLGEDIYTTSKLLGHRSLASTQIYARIVDSKKRTAVDRIKIQSGYKG